MQSSPPETFCRLQTQPLEALQVEDMGVLLSYDLKFYDDSEKMLSRKPCINKIDEHFRPFRRKNFPINLQKSYSTLYRAWKQ